MQTLDTTIMTQQLMKASRLLKSTWPNTVTAQHPKQMLDMLLETASHHWMLNITIYALCVSGPREIDDMPAMDVLDCTYSKCSAKSQHPQHMLLHGIATRGSHLHLNLPSMWCMAEHSQREKHPKQMKPHTSGGNTWSLVLLNFVLHLGFLY